MDNSEPLILTVDFGTQSVRAAIFDKHGETLAMEKKKYDPPYYSTMPNYAEQDPELYWSCLCEVTHRLMQNSGDLLKNVKGMCVTCFRDSAVLLDKDMKVIRPMILWLDQRTAECINKLPFIDRAIFSLVGKYETVQSNRRRSMPNWFIENEPENWARVYKYVNVSTWFIYRLSGELKDSSSNYTGHYPLDFKNRKFYKNPEKNLTAQIFSLKSSMLCELVPEGSLMTHISEEGSKATGLPVGLPIYAAGSDKACETLGLGVIDDHHAAVSYGTASSIETTRTKYTESEPFLPGYPACIPNFYNMEIQVYRGYWMINWFMKEFGGLPNKGATITGAKIEDFNKKLPTIPPGSDGLVLQPFWGPSLSRPFAKGAIIGFSDSITNEHFYRAIIEGIAYALREGMEHFEKKNHRDINEVRVSGGGSQSDEICQITADIFNRPISRVQTFENSSLGAAIAGFMAIGEYKDAKTAVSNMVRVKDTFTPHKDDQEKYDYLYKHVYHRMYPRLRFIYADIKAFNRAEEKKAWAKKYGKKVQ
jgi:sugar (pentulose or hexulose) kinase